MASASDPNDGLFDAFLADNGHEPREHWERSFNKKQCPDCGGLHDESATSCSVCGWAP